MRQKRHSRDAVVPQCWRGCHASSGGQVLEERCHCLLILNVAGFRPFAVAPPEDNLPGKETTAPRWCTPPVQQMGWDSDIRKWPECRGQSWIEIPATASPAASGQASPDRYRCA